MKKTKLVIKKTNETVDEMKWMMLTGQIPVDKITCFSDLHDYCDANMLGNSDELWDLIPDSEVYVKDEKVIDTLREIQDTVDAYLKSVTFEMWKKRILSKMASLQEK